MQFISPLVKQISWTNNLLIISRCYSEEEREFYLWKSIDEHYSKRELDRDVKKAKENPSIGVLLCKDKDDEVVEYALNRSLSPTLVAEYQLCLPDKKILRQKMREIFENTME